MARKPNSWHPEYAAEAMASSERNAHSDLVFVKFAASAFEVLLLVRQIAADLGDSKLAGIAATVGEIEQQIEDQGRRCRRKVTDAQRHALAVALLEKFGTARDVVKAAWGVSDEQIDNADI